MAIIGMEYDTNTGNEVKVFSVTTAFANNTYTPTLTGGTSYYAVGELTKMVTKDENWMSSDGTNRTTEEFKNKSGQVILKRTYGQVDLNGDGDTTDAGESNAQYDTYYIYDDYGNLTYVLPPKIDAHTKNLNDINGEMDDLGYQYVYDHRNRLVEKKIPGKGREYIVYDRLDRPKLTQDALQRAVNKWLFTKYDALGRVAYTGEYTSNVSRISMQNTVDGFTDANLYEDRTGQILMSGIPVFYTARSFPNTTSVTVFTIDYYDTYNSNFFPSGLSVPTMVYGEIVTTDTEGLSVANWTRVLGTTNFIKTVNYYDEKARPIYVYSDNAHLSTTDIIESKLDFTGKVLETRTTHQKSGSDKVEVLDVFEYDHMDRLISQSQKVNEQISERIVRNNYDDLGQLESKLVGNAAAKGYKDVTSGLSIADDEITKTSTVNFWNVGLASEGTIQGDGYIEFSIETSGKFVVVGMATSNPNVGYASMEHAIYVHATNVFVFESNVNKGALSTSYQVGDVFRIERVGSTVQYSHNGKVKYISGISSNGTVMADLAMFHSGGKIKNLHIVDNEEGLQKVDYAYNVRGWLKTVNEDTQNDNDLFNFTLRYNDPLAGTALFNGNISQTSWNTLNTDPIVKTYTYSYDALNRIISGNDNTGNYNLAGVSYDKNGNILTLQRNGHNGTNVITGFMDDLVYTYDGISNQLQRVVDNGDSVYGFKDNGGLTTDYGYDANGNMISDNNKGISSISYNHLNLPTNVSFASQYASINYTYDATGTKLKKYVASMGISPTTTEYAGNYIYENGMLQFFSHPEGYASPEFVSGSIVVWNYMYQYKDHLGSVRLSYSDANNNGTIEIAANTGGNYTEIVEESNYYPFGLKHKGYNDGVLANGNSLAQRKKFAGFELQDELGLQWYDMTARNYDPTLGRWMNLDLLAEQMRRHSPYNYAFNNPIFFIDPDGMMPCPNGCEDEEGKVSEADLDRQHEERVSIQQEVNEGFQKFIEWYEQDPAWARATIAAQRFLDSRTPDFWTNELDENGLKAIGPPKGAQVMWPIEGTLANISYFVFGRTFEYNGRSYQVDSDGKVIRLAPRAGIVPVGPGNGFTRVGRWMSKAEYDIMLKTSQMVEGAGGQTFVTTGGASSFNAASKGSVYVEFDVATNSLIQGGKESWFKVLGPNSSKAMQYILKKQGGELLPNIKNLSEILKVK
jgi:RHS repeat-associated protein